MNDGYFRIAGSEYKVRPFGGPLEQDPRSDIFGEVGYAIAACGRLEFLATMLAVYINKEEDNLALYNPDPDWRYPEIIRLIKRWITKHPAYAHFVTPEDEVFFSSLPKYAEVRNSIAHCLFEAYNPQTKKLTVRSARKESKLGKNVWRFLCIDYDVAAIQHLASQANLAARHFNELAKAIFEEDPEAQS